MNDIQAPFLGTHSRRDWLWGLLLLSLTMLAYQKVWHARFIWDDDLHITKNPVIVGAGGFKDIWLTSAATYYPLTLTSFWIQHALWGLNPVPYHIVNVLVHSMCAILLWRVLTELGVPGAWFAAALWALHPVEVESVAWVTELKNTQSCLFYLVSILYFLRWRKTRSLTNATLHDWRYAAALLCAALAILSKSSTVMLPVVLALTLWWLDQRWRWRNSVPLIPFFLVSALASGWTIWEQKFHSGALGAEWTQTWAQRAIIAGRDIWFYLGKLAWPHPLIFHYPIWKIDASQPLMYMSILSAIIGMFVLWRGRHGRMRPLFFAAAYFVISLFPVLGFFNVYYFRYSFVGDHFQYLASIGPLSLVAAGITTAFDTVEKEKRFLVPTVCGTLLLSLGVLTWRQCAMYTDVETLWRTTIAYNPRSWFAHNNLGAALLQSGQTEEAFVHLQRALEIKPTVAETHSGLAAVLVRMGRTKEAIAESQRALEIQPNDPEAHGILGSALLEMGRAEEAVLHLQKLLEDEPGNVEALTNLGNAFLQLGRSAESRARLEQALAINPNYSAAHYNLANTLLQMRRGGEAVAHLQEVLKIDPDDAEAANNLAWILATWPEPGVRDGAKAIELAEQANEQTARRNPTIAATLAAAYAETGRFAEATKVAQDALLLATDSGNATLAEEIRAQIALYQSGRAFRSSR